jgi:hypothetical protein
MSTEHLTPQVGQVLQALLDTDDEHRKAHVLVLKRRTSADISVSAEAHLSDLLVADVPSILLLLAQIGSLGVGGFQSDVRKPYFCTFS